MAIDVNTHKDSTDHIQAGDAWHVDDFGQLHVRSDKSAKGNLATYARGEWRSVHKVER